MASATEWGGAEAKHWRGLGDSEGSERGCDYMRREAARPASADAARELAAETALTAGDWCKGGGYGTAVADEAEADFIAQYRGSRSKRAPVRTAHVVYHDVVR